MAEAGTAGGSGGSAAAAGFAGGETPERLRIGDGALFAEVLPEATTCGGLGAPPLLLLLGLGLPVAC